MAKKRIKFFIPRVWLGDVYLPIVQYVLKMCYDQTGRYADQIEWCPSYIETSNVEMMWNEFLDHDPDIICFSIYVWNATAVHAVAKRIKEQFPNKILILGGPEIHWKTFEEYALQHSYYDFMIYGDGEEAFVKLIDLIYSNKTTELNLIQIPNLIFKKKNKVIKTPHQIYRGPLYTEQSPWLYNKEEFERDCALIIASGDIPTISWEFDRGCPYECSFCDWQAGLHHKVIRKKYSWYDELILFAKNKCRLHCNNANIGFYKDDAKIIETIYQLTVDFPGFIFMNPCWAKLNGDRVFDMLKRQGEITGKIYAKQHLQSIDPTVLKNIDRPGTDWSEQKQTIIELRKQSNVLVEYHPELIIGMPGETKETWDYAMLELIELYPWAGIDANHWVLLPNSPAANPDYKEKFKLEITPCIELFEDSHDNVKLDQNLTNDDIAKIMAGNNVAENFVWRGNFVTGTYSSTLEDRLYMLISAGIAKNLQEFCGGDINNARNMYKTLKPAVWKRAQEDGAIFRKYLEIHGAIPFFVWHKGRLWMYREAWNSHLCLDILKS